MRVLASIQVGDKIKADIRNAINAGKVVTVHTQPVSYAGGSFTGYIVTDPTTGAGAYLLGNGTNGSDTKIDRMAGSGL